jgi:hypothetical protein
MRNAEAEIGFNPRELNDPYVLYVTPRAEVAQTPYEGGFHDLFIQSNQQLPLIQNPSTFQHVDLYDDEYEERKSFRSNNFDV